MDNKAKTRIIVVGSVNGDIKKLYQQLDSIQSKKGKFDLLLCVGNFFPPKSEEFEEFYQSVLRGKSKVPSQTYFTDSTSFIAPFMNSSKTKEGFDFDKDVHFLGRSGLKVISGLRVAYLAGIDSDLLGDIVSGDLGESYQGNYFNIQDVNKVINDYQEIVKGTGKEGIDVLMCGQWPLNIDPAFTNSLDLDQTKQIYYNSSSHVAILIEQLCPRYIYSSSIEMHHKRLPFLNRLGYLSRFIALASTPGKHKPQDSKAVHIQAIEVEALTRIAESELKNIESEHTDSPYKDTFRDKDSIEEQAAAILDLRMQIGREILDREEEEAKRQQAQRGLAGVRPEDEQMYRQEEKTVYVGGFDRHLSMDDLESFMLKYGKIKNFIRQQDKVSPNNLKDEWQLITFQLQKGRNKGFVFVEYEDKGSAERAIEDSGRANILGRKLTINYKMSRVKEVEDRDCWFCYDNPRIERHLIIEVKEHFYTAIPKGPVVDQHFLIIPKKHIGHSLELDNEQEEEFSDMKALVLNYITQKKGNDYIFFERNVPFKFQKAAHMNVQVIALPYDPNLEERIRKLLKVFEGQQEVKFQEIQDRDKDLRSELGNDPTKSFFYLEVPGLKTARGRQKLRFYCEIKPGARFDLQFGRVLACYLLNEKDKINWKNCILDREEEEKLAKAFNKELKSMQTEGK